MTVPLAGARDAEISKNDVSSATEIASKSDEATARAVHEVIAAGRAAAARHWVPATSGNFSVRIDAGTVAITRSGVDKGDLAPADILVQPLQGALQPRSSAEAPLHLALYRRYPAIGAIFHVHSPASTVLSRLAVDDGRLLLQGWELQKALAGVTTHEATVEIPVFANEQDTEALAARVQSRLDQAPGDGFHSAPGYLLSGHGLYAWGGTPKEAARHLEALEALFDFELSLRRFTP